jgi:anti-anti-sigma factor
MLSFRVVRQDAGDVVVELEGEFARHDWTLRLKDFLERHYIADGVRRIRLDLTNVSALDLEALATLVVLWKEASRNGKALLVEGLHGQPLEKARQTGLLDLLTHG